MARIPARPPGTTESVHAQRVLVLAPHYDDEVLGCGGLLAQLAAQGAAVRILFLTDSSGGDVEPVEDPEGYTASRKAEAKRAVAALGVGEIAHLGFPDGGLGPLHDRLAGALRAAIDDHRPDLLLVTSPLEVSDDHRAAFASLHQLLSGLRGGDALLETLSGAEILAYDVNHPLYPNLLVDVGAMRPKIEAAIDCYVSQTDRHRYREACLGLLAYRTHSLPADVEAAEGYVRLGVDDFRTRSLGQLIESMGGTPKTTPVTDGPLLSVIVRTKDRPALLAEALTSLARSHYRRAEVIVVNDGGVSPQLPAAFPMPIRLVELAQNRGRAAAANAGVEAAEGEAIVFLDDDDLVSQEHLGTLAGLIAAAGVRVAYTDAAVVTYQLDGDEGWAEVERRLPYSREFDPELLLYDNYIPFNTLVIERALFDVVGSFDEDLPFFEDWDWLIRCGSRTPFHHLAQVTCEYRQLKGSGHHVLGDEPRQRADFLAMKARVIAKHASRVNAATAARVVDRLRAEAVLAAEAERQRQIEARDARRDFHAANGRLAALRAEQQAAAIVHETRGAELAGLCRERDELMQEVRRLGERERELGAREEELGTHIAALDSQTGALHGEIARLGTLIETMESTKAWRAHRWFEGLRGRK